MSENQAPTPLPLAGLKVLECGVFQQAPAATALLADFGADVVKVEGPGSPDPGRGILPPSPAGDASPYFESLNRNKRSISLDLKQPAGRETLLQLVKDCDVFVQNLRHGVMQELGLTYEALKAVNPRIIYASGNGYGTKGPHASWAAMDLLGQARAGTMMSQGSPDMEPMAGIGGMADQIGAIYLAFGIMVSLRHRDATGEGQEVEVSLLGTQLAMQTFNVSMTLFSGVVAPRRSRAQASPFWNVFKCGDGRWISIAGAQAERWWELMFRTLERPDILADNRLRGFLHDPDAARELVAIMDDIFLGRSQWEWVNLLADAGLPVAPVQNYGQIAGDPQVVANGYLESFTASNGRTYRTVGPGVQLAATPGSVRTGAPEFGQHTEEVLLEHGFTWDQISALAAKGTIGYRD
jgi:crotonobetainyl-CoA:carnitine CoA-transferase CaiB-like acyl-CoA transferase